MTGGGQATVPSIQTAVEILGKKLTATPSRNSRIIQVEADARSPMLAADIANAAAENFIEQNIETRQRAARQTYDTLRLQLSNLGDKVPAPKGSMTRYGGAARLVDGDRPVYEALQQKADEARIASMIRQTNIRLAGPAQPPARPHKPNLPLNLA